MSEGMMPQRGIVQVAGPFDDCAVVDGIPLGASVVVVPLDRASWDAMVERAARAAIEMEGRAWSDFPVNAHSSFRSDAAGLLRAALALPPDWEPSE